MTSIHTECSCRGEVHWASSHFRWLFGKRVAKLGLDFGIPCPHRKKNPPGCIYCHPYALFPSAEQTPSIPEQIDRTAPRLFARYKTDRFLAYFQNETSTAVPFERLRQGMTDAISHPQSVGVIVSTRPDYVGKKHLELFANLVQKHGKPVWLELGLQSVHEETLKLINRGHSFADFVQTFKLARSYGIEVGVHTILGLPGENLSNMVETHKVLAELGVWSIKIHHLQVLANTALEQMYNRGEVSVFETLDEYLEVLVEVLAHIPWEVVIQRVFTDAPRSLLVAPVWSENKQEALGRLATLMRSRLLVQGCLV